MSKDSPGMTEDEQLAQFVANGPYASDQMRAMLAAVMRRELLTTLATDMRALAYRGKETGGCASMEEYLRPFDEAFERWRAANPEWRSSS